ncbi:butyrophilin subfamily 1 member A1-like [Anarhichas minor]|uniref:butyrophilin subfamily 1 member A1-like n=1 Tax=Anarhichas minor TaxID=65739 RepID=UPI003F73EAF8
MAFSDFTVPLFRPLIVFLLLSQPHGGHCGATSQLQVIGPSQPILATVGDDVILPCRLEPAMNASDMRLEWARPDLSPGFIHVRANRAVSSPAISTIYTSSCKVVLQCESRGWYPEPEVLWLDGEGNLLSAGPTETVRGPDDLYTVSSRVTVEKRHSNSFTCRVQQRTIKQTRETHITVPGGERRSVFIQKTQKTSKKQPGQKTKQLQHDENFRQKLVVTEEHLYWDCDIRP